MLSTLPITFAQVGLASGLTHWVIIAIVVAGILGVLFVITRQVGVVIPPFVITIAWIVLAVFIGVVAIKFLSTLL
jgi:hypothetical protein